MSGDYMLWMLNDMCELEGEKVWEPCADEERGHQIDPYLIAAFTHAKQSLLNASRAMRESYDRSERAKEARG